MDDPVDDRIASRPLPSSRRTPRATALAGACALLLQAAPHALGATLPSVPAELEVPPQHRLVRVDHAVGTQNYVCMPAASGPGFEWVFFGPQATLFSEHGRQTMTHFLSGNPDEGGTPRPTWQESRDTSAIWAAPIASSADPAYVEADAIPWLLLRVTGAERGPKGGARIARTHIMQRLHTRGGKAPATGCSDAADLRKKALVPYEADYYFYRSTARD